MKFEKANCPICESKNFKLISRKGHFRIPIFVSVCKKCGLVMLNPRWDEKSYSNFYEKEYDRYYRENIGKENNLNSVEILDRISKFVKNKKNILDIGSGSGYISSYIKKELEFSFVDAIESSENAKRILLQKNINHVSNFLKEYHTDKKYDLIIMRHVFEHVLEPKEELIRIKKLLSKEGVLYISLPCLENPSISIQNEFFRVVHSFYFCKRDMLNLFNMVGFKVASFKVSPRRNKGEMYFVLKHNKSNSKINYGNYNKTFIRLKTLIYLDLILNFKFYIKLLLKTVDDQITK
ncbi:class I SAM-dependent methyltransferase, partial [Candidatus Pacearchaeota archaeon]|nr:class I SAM-dependent methyltransferase [Candidatus Pacearchaeota archaeon]